MQKRAAEASEEERMAKQMRTDAATTSMAQANAMAATQAMFGSPQQSNLFLLGSQPMLQQPMMPVAPSVPTTKEQHIQMQMQQRQQQQYAAAMAARRNQQQQTAAMVQQSPQMRPNPGANIHVASLMGNQGAPVPGQPQSATAGMQNLVPQARDNGATSSAASVNSNETEQSCLVCGKKGDIFTCNGGCDLHVHPTCIGEDAIFPFVVGQLCGSCFIVQQNRASPEDLTKGGPHALSVRRAILCVNLETNSNTNFDKFGHLASLRLGEIGSIAGYPIKPFAEKFVEPYLQVRLHPFDVGGVSWELFTDQLRMIFGLLDIMSNFGTLQLNPDLFVPEVNIIFNAAYMNQAMIANEFEVVGKFIQCMKLFGQAKSMENANMIQSCERYLLFKHLPNGSWCKTNGSTVDQYKATVTCSKALLTPAFRGYGPISQDFQRLLEKWARNAAPKLPSAAMTGGKQSTDTNKLKLLVSGATVKTNTQVRLKRLEAMYKRQTALKGGNPLEFLMAKRMKQLLRAKKHEADSKPTAENIKKEAGSNTTNSNNVKEEGNPVDNDVKEEILIKREEEVTVDTTTDSEDIKSENQTADDDQHDSTATGDDDDMLTSMSLHEDLEIFDGLQFEDGGGIIDMSFQSLEPQGDADNDSGEPTMEDADDTDAPGQDEDETMDEHVVDDDEDENDAANGETSHQETQFEGETLDAIDSVGDVTADFPEM
ncbi:hypothetical protein PHMEG_000668 [Phytophthora megakarya]|uniref:Zinc finger PHD-type domain-containing protein n=1 Tax=Phytophthora megakarya TaxID=4795 RepID=A0A225X307_9STRA|nr:hypothetical protein PHMEG_000668 [Phytophthora megakarya]